MPNPYTLTFGKEPLQTIPRTVQETEVINSLTAEPPGIQAYMVTGIRGCGKTVFMSRISKAFSEKSEWVAVELNPHRDMLQELAAKLCAQAPLAKMFRADRLDLSLFGLGISAKRSTPITDIESALEKMCAALAKRGKKLIITIDEASNSKEMRIFAAAFQILVRADLPVFLVMTGLYENISALQNEKSLTFLYRAPKITLNPLNIGIMADSYRKELGVDDNVALRHAQLTRGYAFAFQVFGYFAYQHGGSFDEGLQESKQYLDDYVYDKVWETISGRERQIAAALSDVPSGTVGDIRAKLQMGSGEFGTYRDKLIKRGVLKTEGWGHIGFALPLFERYIREHTAL